MKRVLQFFLLIKNDHNIVLFKAAFTRFTFDDHFG